MKTLEFGDGLVVNAFSSNNTYGFPTILEKTGIICSLKKQREIPYILKSNLHPSNSNEVLGCFIGDQLGGRIITTAKLKEVLDTAKALIYLSIGDNNYMVGKGLLAKYMGGAENAVELLYIATYPYEKRGLTISDVKFYVSRKIYQEEHKKVFPAIKDIMYEHTGDVIITNNVEKHAIVSIDIPNFKTLVEKKAYIDTFADKIVAEWSKG